MKYNYLLFINMSNTVQDILYLFLKINNMILFIKKNFLHSQFFIDKVDSISK